MNDADYKEAKTMKLAAAIFLSIGLLAAAPKAHCGSCGTEKNHDHTTKAVKQTDASSIIETAEAAGSFKTLLAAVEAADLSGALSGDGPFTVFAPTDDAFAALPKGTVEALLKDTEKLTAILTYHVLDGAVKSGEVVKIESAETLNGQSVAVKVSKGRVMIDNANVTTTDIICSNGVIHVIDAVMLPKEEKPKG